MTRAGFAADADLEASGFGKHRFMGDVAAKYLGKYGETPALLETSAWTANKSDLVASAILDWAKDNGASSYVHWFQPMGASGFRSGMSGNLYNMMVEFDSRGSPQWKARL